MAVTRITLTYELGRSADLEAEPVPVNGRVHFAPSVRVLDTEGNVILERARITATVTDGVMDPVSVVATDSDDISPTSGLYYRVTEDVGAKRSWNLAVPADSPGGELNLATVAPLSTPPAIVFPIDSAEDHIEDPTGAHAASAVAFTPVGSIAATDVQAAVAEVATEAAAGTSAEAVLRAAGDAALSSDLDALDAATTTALATKAASADLTAEIAARTAADSTEATARAAADTAEAAARSAADTAEATARANAVTAEATARADADALLIPLTQKAAANGVATLDGTSKIPAAQLPSVALTDTFVVASQAAMLALTAERGDVAIRSDLSKAFILSTDSPGTLGDWKELLTPADAVSSVNGRSGAVTGLAEATDVTSEAAARATADALLVVKSANLSDLANAGTARSNLGLGAQANTTDLRTALINLNLLASGGSNPLDLNGGALTANRGAFGTNPASAGTVRLPNNSGVASRNAANSGDVEIIKATAADQVQIAAGGALTLFGGVARLANNIALAGRNAANSGDINLIQLNGSDQVSVAGGGAQTNVGGVLRLSNNVQLRGRNAAASADIPIVVLNSSDQVSIASGGATTIFGGPVKGQPEVIGVALSDETTAITAGNGKATIRMPFAMTLQSVRANVNTVSSSGLVTVDINEGGTTILSTKLSIDASEKTSVTAATAAVISDTALADDAEITFDIDAAGTGAKGLKVWLLGVRA